MSKQEQIRRLWNETFSNDSREYTDMYFSRIYSDDNALVITNDEGRAVSTLQLAQYEMLLEGSRAGVCYIGGAITSRRYRGKGYMSRLMLQAIDIARERGNVMCALIPAHDWLYFFFDRFGFSSVYLADRQCYTSFHPFATRDEYVSVPDHYSDSVYEAFVEFEQARGNGVIHTRRDLVNTLDELSLRPGGTFVAVGRKDVPVAGMAWAVDCGAFVQVNELLGVDDDGRTAAMHELRSKFPDRQFTVLAPAQSAQKRRLHPRGMGRIIDVGACLSILAAGNPKWQSAIRVYDPLIADNCHIYLVSGGTYAVDDTYSGKLNFDVTIDVFTRIVFSSRNTGEILGFPSERTHISLMPH